MTHRCTKDESRESEAKNEVDAAVDALLLRRLLLATFPFVDLFGSPVQAAYAGRLLLPSPDSPDSQDSPDSPGSPDVGFLMWRISSSRRDAAGRRNDDVKVGLYIRVLQTVRACQGASQRASQRASVRASSGRAPEPQSPSSPLTGRWSLTLLVKVGRDRLRLRSR